MAIDVSFRDAPRPSEAAARDRGVHPGIAGLAAGSVHSKGGLPLPCALQVDRDVQITMRDGVRIRADVWRPVGVDHVPTILSYTPYGKAGGYWSLDNFPFRAGVPRRRVSGLQSFESPDPAYWCAHGYAVVVVDVRGSYHSEGDMIYWGDAGAQDGYDVVEWIAAQPWSTGKIGMSGNSQLAIMQWFIAASRPPHLTAIAPWEGLTDMYRDNIARGGVPFPEFNLDVSNHAYGEGRLEDIPQMLAQRPLYDDYWAGKAARIEEIDIPAYVVASFTNPLHAGGTLDAFRRLPDRARSWLRIHNTMEWPDYYSPANVEDLRRFFDHYLLGRENGWDSTPRVRSAILDLGGTDQVDVPLDAWPPTDSETATFYLNGATGALEKSPPSASSVAYRADGTGSAFFSHTFEADTTVAGYGSVKLFLEIDEGDDADVYVLVEKLSRRGKRQHRNLMPPPLAALGKAMHAAYLRGKLKLGFIFYLGLDGRLRASHRELDASSTELEPRHLHTTTRAVAPGEVVELDIPLWPAMSRWRAGETLRVMVADHDPRGPWFPTVPTPQSINRGTHRFHTGGSHPSALKLAIQKK